MIYENLYNQALIQPIRDGADELKILSGYATSAMAFHHLEEIKSIGKKIDISLVVGMTPSDGLSISNHRGFQNILKSEHSNNFHCSYIYAMPPVHSKLYIWKREGEIFKAFIGSANYTQNAFSNKQREILTDFRGDRLDEYFDLIERDSIFCDNAEAEQLIKIYNDKNYYRRHMHEDNQVVGEMVAAEVPSGDEVENVTFSLLGRDGEVQRRGGLNWGQREGRNPNQAYIQLPPKVYRSDFFPIRPQHFTVLTDDSKTFICTRAQKSEEGQAIETPHNNALLGEYFRNRLGLANGAFVSKEDLEAYGRTDITFYKFDDENYYLDFSV